MSKEEEMNKYITTFQTLYKKQIESAMIDAVIYGTSLIEPFMYTDEELDSLTKSELFRMIHE